jgi:uncharacterized protein YqeY
MSLQEDIKKEMVEAMKAKDEIRLRVLRGLVTLFTQELTATKRTPQDTLSDDEVLTLVRRALKQRNEAADQFINGGRDDLAENEKKEAEVLKKYLPAMLSDDEVEKVVDAKINEMGLSDKKDMGKLIGAVMGELKGKADGSVVRKIIENKLA